MILVLAILMAPAAVFAAPIDIYSTGVDDSGALLPDWAVDPHYTLAGSTTDPDVYANGYPEAHFWVANTTTSQWITDFTQALGPFVYSTTFDLTGYDHTSATLGGLWSADDQAIMKLNGVVVASLFFPLTQPWQELSAFAINSGFIAGFNTLTFEVPNIGGPSGLHVQIAGDAALTAVPEPSTFALAAVGLGLMYRQVRRRRSVVS
jgi:hypothetical protein